MIPEGRTAILAGVGLMFLGTLFASGADAALKSVASDYAAPQVLVIAAVLSIGLTLFANIGHGFRRVVQTGAPIAMAARAGATVVAATGFYQAFVRLPFAEVFLFIGAMPLLAAVLSALFLREPVSVRGWLVLGIGFAGLFCIFPITQSSAHWTGFGFAGLGSVAGTVSVVLARHIARHNTHSLAQVFLPQLGLGLVMLVQAPFVYAPMTSGDFARVCLYATLVFGARWTMVIVARLLPAWMTLQLLSVQFVWMVGLGFLLFDEQPTVQVYLGAALIVVAGALLARQELAKVRPLSLATPEPKQREGQFVRGLNVVRKAAQPLD